jgi:DNA repair exonuclease SbcCD ATPase subunit
MVGATEVEVTRDTRLGNRRARLTITRPGETPELVSTLRAVNERIVAELGRLDNETLLNSCFLEQKKLQRLEDLSQGDRLASLLRLLNLENLTRLETRFKPVRADDDAIHTAEQRCDLARVRADIPARQAELAAIDRRQLGDTHPGRPFPYRCTPRRTGPPTAAHRAARCRP